MKNITLKIDDETYRKARIRAAEEGTSVSALVREFLHRECEASSEEERLAELEALYREADGRAKAAGNAEPLTPMTRDEIYADRLP